MLAGIPGTEHSEDDGGEHADGGENGAETHIPDHDAVEHRGDDSLSRHQLGNFITGLSCDVALQRLVVGQHVNHILELQVLMLADAREVFRFIKGGNADAGEENAQTGQSNDHKHCHGQVRLVVFAAGGFQYHVAQHDGQGHRHDIIEGCQPNADLRPLFGIVRHERRNGLSRHVHQRIPDDVNHIRQGKGRHAQPLAGEQMEHAQQSETLDQPAHDQQDTDLAEAGVHPVVHESQKGVGHSIQDPGAHDDDANDGSGDAEADAGCVARLLDEDIYRHVRQC